MTNKENDITKIEKDEDAYQISLLSSKKINSSDSILGKVFDYFFSE